MLDILSAIIANKVSGGGSGSSGGGLPSGGEPHQMLVTDADGKTVWEERTCYSYTERTGLVDNARVEATVNGGFAMAVNPFAVELIVGKEYVVVMDGNEYRCICYSDSYSLPAIGNSSIGFPETSDTGEPFYIESSENGVVVIVKQLGVYAFSVYFEETTRKYIDPKYLSVPIIKESIYDRYLNWLAGNGSDVPSFENTTFTCANMTFDDAYAIMVSGQPLDAIVMRVNRDEDMSATICERVPMLCGGKVSWGIPCIAIKLPDNSLLYWSEYGFTTTPPVRG